MSAAREESWDAYRQQMLAETSRFIEWGLKHPDEVIEIPAKPVEDGDFPQAVAEWFWSTVLMPQSDGLVQRWRRRLRRVGWVLAGGG